MKQKKTQLGVIVARKDGSKVALPCYEFNDEIYESLGEMHKLAKKAKRKLRFAVKYETYLGVWFE